MKMTELYAKVQDVLAELERPRWERAHVLAKVEIESKSTRDPSMATDLAAIHSNLTGIKWTTLYPTGHRIAFNRKNEFDKADPPLYVKFRSPMDWFIRGHLWHMHESRNYNVALPLLRAGRIEDYIRAVETTWCDENPRHAETVLALYRNWLGKLEG